MMKRLSLCSYLVFIVFSAPAVAQFQEGVVRERLLMDADWKFAFGHSFDKTKDFNFQTSYFSYLAKAGYGDGPAAKDFDDRTWRSVDLPHDWAVEASFSIRGSHSHGYKAVGPGFPESSVGWYRKTFSISESDKEKRFILEFDGVSRDALVFVNGFFCGREPSGYYSFSFDITEFLNIGGVNSIAVRADVSVEEGWYYEGAGIYRHVWLNKVAPIHIPLNGTFIQSSVEDTHAKVTISTDVISKEQTEEDIVIQHCILDQEGRVVVKSEPVERTLTSFEKCAFHIEMEIPHPHLWSLDSPYLYSVVTTLSKNGKVTDEYGTSFGIRTIRFDPDKGFFLNGQSVKIMGTNNHQDHAGVGCAIPDGLQEWRVRQLKAMGSNALRTSHHPPTPELLDICDKLGMLVIDENRLMGVSEQNLDYVRRLIERDRNHPSVILWSIGNEEWAIENNERGARIASLMQSYAKSLDPTRPINAALSGSWGHGISSVIEVMGFNYLRHGSTDAQHAKFPWQSSVGTEEGSTNTTRGIYMDNQQNHYLVAYDKATPSGFMSIHDSWNHYASRDYLAGVFYWTGFDYRGESTPFGWPSVTSYFGILDLCGFPKDNYYYLKSWWSNEPVLHILPHWNWPDQQGREMDVWVYSNCNEVELFLNGKSLGKKEMVRNGRLEWKVNYSPGTLKAIGYSRGKKPLSAIVKTTGQPDQLFLSSDGNALKSNGEDIAVVTVKVADKNGEFVPNSNVPVSFSIEGSGTIIGVGNGDPTSHEKERFLQEIAAIDFKGWKEIPYADSDFNKILASDCHDSDWKDAFSGGGLAPGSQSKKTIYRSSFQLTEKNLNGTLKWMYSSIGRGQVLYINGYLISDLTSDPSVKKSLELDKKYLHAGENTVVILAEPFVKSHPWDNVNTVPGSIQVLMPDPTWQRSLFNGLAQVIVQVSDSPGQIVLKASSPGLKEAEFKMDVMAAGKRPHVASEDDSCK